jgi:hypothetical protein
LKSLLRFSLLAGIKALSRLFYAFTWEWVGHRPHHPWRNVRIGIILNHTTLFEPILFGVLPFQWLWRVANVGLLPGADSTLDRPFVGQIFKWMMPDVVGVTRNRDRTWTHFLDRMKDDSIVLLAPEGRMKRRNGLDKHGRPMNVKGGIVEIIEKCGSGTMMILYSGGLHHVQCPGEGFPRLFRRVYARLEAVNIEHYMKQMGHGTPEFRKNVMTDLERRRDVHCHWKQLQS